ncbi:MAG: class I SAM-dependent methyltransferase [Nanoarchaeota archaeon]|nr:class I SAM-dependent methyltransferase [Nanoarchaeota archaeon]MBU0962496.1 class I SAM-dependent methyltransferase [Nanoarchaeota archaeon]
MNNYEKEWDNVWSKKTFLSRMVTYGRNFYDKFFFKLILPFESKEKKFLEIGCGTSSLLLKLANNFKKCVGLDISNEALKISSNNAERLKIKNVNFIKGDCFNLPIKNNIFDVVWSQGLIEHFENPLKIIEEHYRVCKKGGVVLISTPAKYSYQSIWYLLTRPKFLRRFWPWTYQEFYTKRKYKKLIKSLNYNYKIFKLPGDLTKAFIILKIEK